MGYALWVLCFLNIYFTQNTEPKTRNSLHQSPHLLTTHQLLKISFLIHIEYNNGKIIFHA